MSTLVEYPEIELSDEQLEHAVGAAGHHWGHFGFGFGFGGLGLPLGLGFGAPVVDSVVPVADTVVEQPVTTVQTTTTYQLV